MKPTTTFRLISVILLLSFSIQGFSQTTDDYYNRLYHLCKVWGHVKYFHAEVAKGTINWDNQLLAAIEATRAVTSDVGFNAVLLTLLNSAGPMATSTVPLPVVPDEMNINKDHLWMDDPIFSTEVKAILHDIQDKFRPQPNFYVTKLSLSNAVFDSDNQYYDGATYPSEGLRLLSLFRFWNIHNYFLPYKYQMVNNIDGLLTEFIPRMVEASNELDYHLGIKELTGKMVDAHSMTFSPVVTNWDGTSYPPFLVKLVEGKTVVTKILPGAPVSVGDIIEEIDGVAIDVLREGLRKYGFGSNDPAIEYTVTNMIMWDAPGTYTLKASNPTNIFTADFTRNETNYGMLTENNTSIWSTTTVEGCTFGIVDMVRLEVADVAPMFSELWNTNAIIFDIRGYPKSTLWTIINYLFPGPIHIADFTCPDVNYPGTLWRKNEYIGTGTNNPYSGKVLMLFDERARSLSEYTTMGLELFPDAIKIGNTTAGADANVAWVYLPGNCYVTMNGLGCFYPDGTQRSRQGIIPDYDVKPTIDGIRAGKDELMEFATDCALLSLRTDYCKSYGNATTEWIASVSLGANSNTSGSSGTAGYQNFENPVFTLESGKSVSITLEPGFSKTIAVNWSVWIDFDGDQGFDGPGELVFSQARSRKTVTGTVVIPSGLSRTTRMRVSMSSDVMPGPCSQLVKGEVEDYVVQISGSTPVPLVAEFKADQVNVSAGTTVQFTDQSTGTPVSWSWTFSGDTPSASNLKNPSVLYSTPGIFDVTLTVTRPDASDIETKSGYITVNEVAQLPYCEPVNINSNSDYISSVVVGALSNTSTGTGYALYTSPTILNPGVTYPVKLTPNNSTVRNYWKIWIDFNGDGDFIDAGESLLTASNKKGAYSGSLTIPSTVSGTTRMRVSMRSGSSPLPCDDGFIGEVEDYEVSLGNSEFIPENLRTDQGLTEDPYSRITLYPNPAGSELFISLGSLSGAGEYEIYTIEGKQVARDRILSTVTRIDISHLVPGIYLVRINANGMIKNRKFIRD